VAKHIGQTGKLAQDVWHEALARINNREPLLRRPKALALFGQVFREAMPLFPFDVRGLRIEADRISFYSKPENGLGLRPERQDAPVLANP
jgi:hypothetical protein